MNIQLFENSDRKLCYVNGQKGYMNNAKKKFCHSKFTFKREESLIHYII